MDDLEEFLEHHGVKGMKWGVRKNYDAIRNRPLETKELVTEKGTRVKLVEKRSWPVTAAVGSVSGRARRAINASRSFEIHADNKKVGNVRVKELDSERVNFAWVGVDAKERGKGYASTVFDAGVAYAKDKGYHKITLEVPGNAPDARHIYEKRGFKQTGKTWGDPNDRTDPWGGLTEYELDIR